MKERDGLTFTPLKGSTAQRLIRPERMLAPDPRLQAFPRARLLGAWATPQTLVLERPGQDQALAVAVAALAHNLCAVVDLSCRSEQVTPHVMDNGTRSFGEHSSATFAWGRHGEIALDEGLQDAKSAGMEVSACINGEAVTRDVSNEPPYMYGADCPPTQRPLELIKIPLLPGKPVTAEQLFNIGRLMEQFRADGSGHPIAVQCPSGDMRAAAVAAADLLYSRFQEGALTQETATDLVKDIWTRLCLDYSIDLADQPEQLAQLLGLGERLLKDGKRTMRWR